MIVAAAPEIPIQSDVERVIEARDVVVVMSRARSARVGAIC